MSTQELTMSVVWDGRNTTEVQAFCGQRFTKGESVDMYEPRFTVEEGIGRIQAKDRTLVVYRGDTIKMVGRDGFLVTRS